VLQERPELQVPLVLLVPQEQPEQQPDDSPKSQAAKTRSRGPRLR
jgi:hypothetical protein